MNKMMMIIVAGVISIGILASVGYEAYTFHINCGGHLERAANANSIELAKKELDTALTYIEEKGLTKGNTAIFFETPANDLGYWYENLNATRNEVTLLSGQEITPLETSNVLMKLRETVLSSNGTVTKPFWISLHPNQFFWLAFMLLFVIVDIAVFVYVVNDI